MCKAGGIRRFNENWYLVLLIFILPIDNVLPRQRNCQPGERMTETMKLNQRTAVIWGPAAAILIGALIGLSSARAVGSKPAVGATLAAKSKPIEVRPAVESYAQQIDSFGYTLGLPDQLADTGILVSSNTERVADRPFDIS